jgi:hypothetical protein
MKLVTMLVTGMFCFALVATAKMPTVYAAKPSKPSVEVIFMDGAIQRVEQASLVYEWVYESQNQYINAPRHKRETLEFHYLQKTRGMELDLTVPCGEIERIEIVWPKGAEYFAPEGIVVIRRNGQKLTLSEAEVGATSAFLQATPIEKITEPSIFRYLNLQGVAVVGGQRGKFSGRVTCRGCVALGKSEAIKEIRFLPAH